MNSKQLTFGHPTTVTKVYPDGKEERLTYGYYESILITKENGYPVNRCKILITSTHPVTDFECEDGSKLLFNKPIYFIELSGRGD